MIKNILITGSSGTVATALVKSLSNNKSYNIIPLDIRPSIWDRKIEKKTKRIDLRKPLTNLKLKKKPDLIIHLAANARVHDSVIDPSLAHDNHMMTYHLLEYARVNKISKFIFASSREIYGESTANHKRSEASLDIRKLKSPYTASKFGSEALIHSYANCYDFDPVIVRLSNVYGRYDASERVIPLFIYYAMKNRDLTIFGAEKKLDFTFIDDAVVGFEQIVKKYSKVKNMTFNLSRGKSEKLIDIAKIIIKKLGSNSKISIDHKRVGEISSFTADLSNAKKQLGYNPKVNIDEGLQKTVDWYLKVRSNKRIYDHQRRNLLKRGWQ